MHAMSNGQSSPPQASQDASAMMWNYVATSVNGANATLNAAGGFTSTSPTGRAMPYTLFKTIRLRCTPLPVAGVPRLASGPSGYSWLTIGRRKARRIEIGLGLALRFDSPWRLSWKPIRRWRRVGVLRMQHLKRSQTKRFRSMLAGSIRNPWKVTSLTGRVVLRDFVHWATMQPVFNRREGTLMQIENQRIRLRS